MKFQLTLKSKGEDRIWGKLNNDCRWVTRRDFDDGWKPFFYESTDAAQSALNSLVHETEWCISLNAKHDVNNWMTFGKDKATFEITKVANGAEAEKAL